VHVFVRLIYVLFTPLGTCTPQRYSESISEKVIKVFECCGFRKVDTLFKYICNNSKYKSITLISYACVYIIIIIIIIIIIKTFINESAY